MSYDALHGFLPAFLVLSAWLTFAPQAYRVITSGAAGVSAQTWAAMLAGRVTIIAYGLVVQDPVQVASAAFPAAAAAVILYTALARYSTQDRARTARWAAYTLAVSASAFAAPVVVPFALVSMAALSIGPQLLLVLRSTDVSGVSASTWFISAVSSAGWVLHGVLEGFAAVIAANSIWLLGSAAIALRVAVGRRH